MKLHLPTALRRALLALIALLSPAVITTTFATDTLAAIATPAMAEDLTLDGTHVFTSNETYGSVSTGANTTSIEATTKGLTFKAEKVIVKNGHTLTITNSRNYGWSFMVESLDTSQGGSIKISSFASMYATGTFYDLYNKIEANSIEVSGSGAWSIYGKGHSDSETTNLVKTSDLFEKLSTGYRTFFNITEGNVIIDKNISDNSNSWLKIGVENGTTDTYATVSTNVTQLGINTLIFSDSKMEIEESSEALTVDYIEVSGELVSNRDLILEGQAYVESEASVTLNGHTTIDKECAVLGILTTVGGITINNGAELNIASGATLNIGAPIVCENGGVVDIGQFCTINIISSCFDTENITYHYSKVDNGYLRKIDYTVLTGTGYVSVPDGSGIDWSVDGLYSTYSNGVVTVTSYDSSVYHVASGTVDYGTDETDLATDTTKFCMKGGSLVLSKNLKDTQGIEVDVASSVSINNGVTLKASQLDTSAAGVTLSGEGSYDMQGQELSGKLQLADGVALDAAAWEGTIYTGSTAQGAALDIRALGNSQSTVYVGAQPVLRSTPAETVLESLTAAGVGTTVVPGSLTLQKGTSTADTLVVNGILTLGSADAVASLAAVAVDAQTLNVQLTDEVLSNQQTDTPLTLVTLEEGFNGMLTFNGSTETENVSSADNSLEYTLAWNDDSTVLTLTIQGVAWEPSSTYVTDQVKPTTHNGRAGVELMTEVYLNSQPQTDAPDGALAGILNAVDAATATDRDMAAVAGASTAALGMALSGDVERQLSAIRNRSMAGNNANTTTLADEKSGLVDTASPARFFAWVNAEGNRAEQDADSTAAGYTLTSWGGTLGAGMQVNDKLSLGLALTAMYGNLQSDAPDSLKGDMDTTYVSAFARYNKGKWSHAFIGTVGTMEADYKRTVSHAAGSYSTTGDTDGTALGLMYEVSREMQLSNGSSLSPVFNIAYRHTEVDSYNESGADAALNVGKQSMDTVTAGAGARYAAVVGQRMLNRACGFEARALVKYDLGDRQSTTSTGFINRATRAGIESAEVGAFGVELGAGISVPVGTGSIFADAAVELRSDYTNFNAAVGYRVQF